MPKKLTQLTAATAVADADQLLIEQSGTSKRATRDLVAPLPMNYIAGLITSNNGGDPDADVDIAVGVARDDTDVDNIRLVAAITKQIDAAWAVGTDQGGLDTGGVAGDTMYALWLIKRSDTGVVDALISASFTAPTMPTDYDRKRLIGALRTDGASDIIPYRQTGDYFQYLSVHLTDVSDNSLATGVYETGTLSVPPNAQAQIVVNLANATTTDLWGRASVRTKGSTATGAVWDSWLYMQTSGTFDQGNAVGDLIVDSNRQMEYEVTFTDGSPTLKVTTLGFRMLTRSNP